MLKARKPSVRPPSKGKVAAMKEILKDDNLRNLYMRVPEAVHVKLRIYLAKNNMTLAQFMTEVVKNL